MMQVDNLTVIFRYQALIRRSTRLETPVSTLSR